MQPMHHQHYPQAQPTDWSNYYDPQQQHAIYNNSYNNYKDYNCLNQPQQQPPIPPQVHPDPSTMYNGSNYYYHYQQSQIPDPYHQQQQQQPLAPPHHLQQQQQHLPTSGIDYQQQHSNYHQNPTM